MGLTGRNLFEAVDIKYDGAKQHARQVPRTGPLPPKQNVVAVLVVVVVVVFVIVGVQVAVVLVVRAAAVAGGLGAAGL